MSDDGIVDAYVWGDADDIINTVHTLDEEREWAQVQADKRPRSCKSARTVIRNS